MKSRRGHIMMHYQMRIVEAAEFACRVQAEIDFVILARDQGVVHLSQIGAPSADALHYIAADGHVRPNRPVWCVGIVAVEEQIVAEVAERKRSPDIARTTGRQPCGRRHLPVRQYFAADKDDVVRAKQVNDAIQPIRCGVNVVIGQRDDVAVAKRQATVQREALALLPFQFVANGNRAVPTGVRDDGSSRIGGVVVNDDDLDAVVAVS